MERKFLHSLFYKVEKDVCIKNCTAGKYRRSEKCQKKCQQTGQEIHGRRSEENGENAQKRIWKFYECIRDIVSHPAVLEMKKY